MIVKKAEREKIHLSNRNVSNQSSFLEDLEIRLLLEGIYENYGFDFREYAFASLKRRVIRMLVNEGLDTVSALQDRVLHDKVSMERFLLNLSVNVTAMFRDPLFYRAFRDSVIPLLRTYPFIRIWHAGCSTGEEVYSLAILLHEEGIGKKSRIYATDMNEIVIQKAKEGIYPLQTMKEYTKNYIKAGGTGTFSDYYTAKYDNAIIRPFIKENIVFSRHNLVSDRSFNEFNAILCRNVMIYFSQPLQNRVLELLHSSLARFGILALGQKESLRFTPYEDKFEGLNEEQKIYKRNN